MSRLHRLAPGACDWGLRNFFISGLMSENGTVQFMFRMALNS